MNRKKFLKNSLLGAIGLGSGVAVASTQKNIKSTIDQLKEPVGFNHLPNKEEKTMKTVFHKADTRGNANHGWLNANHSFSFANYYNPERTNFGVLRVLNDDQIAAGKGFGKHPHDNMEIITIPLEGDLEHQDSMGNKEVVREGDVQVMSAGTGVYHSEYNKNADKDLKLLQIWVIPNKKGVEPRYDQITLQSDKMKNTFYQLISPNENDEGAWIYQNAWFHMGEFDGDAEVIYSLKSAATNGVYAFLIEGKVEIEGQELNRRDGFGIWETAALNIKVTKGTKLLLMEVPMSL